MPRISSINCLVSEVLQSRVIKLPSNYLEILTSSHVSAQPKVRGKLMQGKRSDKSAAPPKSRSLTTQVVLTDETADLHMSVMPKV